MSYKFHQIPAGTYSTTAELIAGLKTTYNVPEALANQLFNYSTKFNALFTETTSCELYLSENELGYFANLAIFSAGSAFLGCMSASCGKSTSMSDIARDYALTPRSRAGYLTSETYSLYKLSHLKLGTFDGFLMNPISITTGGTILSILGVTYRAVFLSKYDNTSGHTEFLARMSNID